MQRVCVILVGILALRSCRATPAGSRSDDGDKPSPIRYTFRVETIEFGPEALRHEIHYSPVEVGDSGEDGFHPSNDYVNCLEENDDDSDEYEVEMSSLEDLSDQLKKLDLCQMEPDGPLIPKQGCVHFDEDGNVHILHAIRSEEVEGVYVILLTEYGLEKCEMIDDGLTIPGNGCVFIDDEGSIHFMGVFIHNLDYTEDEEVPPLIIDENGDLFVIDEEGDIHVVENQEQQMGEQQEDQQQYEDPQQYDDQQQEEQQQDEDQQQEEQQQDEDQQQEVQQQDEDQQQEEQQQEEQQEEIDVFTTGRPLFTRIATNKNTHDLLSHRATLLAKRAMAAVEKKMASEEKFNKKAEKHKHPTQHRRHKPHQRGRQ